MDHKRHGCLWNISCVLQLLNPTTDQSYSLEQGVIQAQRKRKSRFCLVFRHTEVSQTEYIVLCICWFPWFISYDHLIFTLLCIFPCNWNNFLTFNPFKKVVKIHITTNSQLDWNYLLPNLGNCTDINFYSDIFMLNVLYACNENFVMLQFQEELKKLLEDAKARLAALSSPEPAPVQRRKSRKSES